MLASGEQAQHARGVSGIGGLAEKLAVDDNHGVGAEHEIMRTLTCNRKRLLPRQALGTVPGAFSGQRLFRNVRRLHLESDASVTQQFPATRRQVLAFRYCKGRTTTAADKSVRATRTTPALRARWRCFFRLWFASPN